MKKIIFSSLLLLCGFLLTAQNSFEKVTLQISPKSNLSITGDTNISKFECNFNTSFLKKSQTLYYSQKGFEITFTGARLLLDNRGFDCGSKGINRDFHDLLKTEEYPEILLELSKVTLSSSQKGIATVCITIAGKQNYYNVPVAINNQEIAQFKGALRLNIKDFGLEAPKKFLGMIVVKDDININFDLHIRKLADEN